MGVTALVGGFTASAVVAAALGGCGVDPEHEQVLAAAQSFTSAVAGGDGEGACRLLTEEARRSTESFGRRCAEQIVQLDDELAPVQRVETDRGLIFGLIRLRSSMLIGIQINAAMQVTDVNGIQRTLIPSPESEGQRFNACQTGHLTLATLPTVDTADHALRGGGRPVVVPHACHKRGSTTVNQGHT